jgi:hypothetical protein
VFGDTATAPTDLPDAPPNERPPDYEHKHYYGG